MPRFPTGESVVKVRDEELVDKCLEKVGYFLDFI